MKRLIFALFTTNAFTLIVLKVTSPNSKYVWYLVSSMYARISVRVEARTHFCMYMCVLRVRVCVCVCMCACVYVRVYLRVCGRGREWFIFHLHCHE